MRVTDLLTTGKVTYSFEIIPPKRGITKDVLLQKIAPLMEVHPLFVDVTTHRNDVILNAEGSSISGYSVTRHPSTLHVCESIRNKFDVEVVPHLICGGFTKSETQDVLIDMSYLGYDNVVALRGDKLSYEKKFTPTLGGNNNSIELLDQISKFNEGKLLCNESFSVNRPLCVGAGCYPESHSETPNVPTEIVNTYDKLCHGVDYLITQMFFDNNKFQTFYDGLHAGVNVPIIPGIKVLSSESQIASISSLFSVEIPFEFSNELSKTSDPKTCGTQWCIAQCKDLIKRGHSHLHFFTMNSDLVLSVIKEL